MQFIDSTTLDNLITAIVADNYELFTNLWPACESKHAIYAGIILGAIGANGRITLLNYLLSYKDTDDTVDKPDYIARNLTFSILQAIQHEQYDFLRHVAQTAIPQYHETSNTVEISVRRSAHYTTTDRNFYAMLDDMFNSALDYTNMFMFLSAIRQISEWQKKAVLPCGILLPGTVTQTSISMAPRGYRVGQDSDFAERSDINITNHGMWQFIENIKSYCNNQPIKQIYKSNKNYFLALNYTADNEAEVLRLVQFYQTIKAPV